MKVRVFLCEVIQGRRTQDQIMPFHNSFERLERRVMLSWAALGIQGETLETSGRDLSGWNGALIQAGTTIARDGTVSADTAGAASRCEVVFVDASVPDSGGLLRDLVGLGGTIRISVSATDKRQSLR